MVRIRREGRGSNLPSPLPPPLPEGVWKGATGAWSDDTVAKHARRGRFPLCNRRMISSI